MPTTQEKPPFHHRFSGNILSRMLQMEKQSKQNRLSSHTTTLDQDKPISFTSLIPQPTAMSPQTALNSHPPSGRMHRSTTAPNLSPNTKGLGLGHSVSQDTHVSAAVDDRGDEESEICLSPSWSEFGNKKKKDKKKVEKERKEMEKKQKKELEQQRAAETKAGKRLSKKPPAAMDTQKMPSALRRNSGHSFVSQSPSHEESRRSSREVKRFSGASIISDHGSRPQSMPSASANRSEDPQGNRDTVTSSAAPQIPKMRNFSWHSHHSSSGNSSGGDITYERALVDFTSRLDAAASTTDPQTSPTVPPKDYRPVTQPSQNQQPAKDHRPWTQPAQIQQINQPLARSQTTPNLQMHQGQGLNGKSVERLSPIKHESTTSDTAMPEQGRPHSSHQHINIVQQASDETPKAESEQKVMLDEFTRISRTDAGNGGEKAQPLQINSHHDGSSYVHKQRMYQQQRSIAGFQDELAIRDANERKPEDETVEKSEPSTVPSRSVSSESSKPPTRQTSIECDCRPEGDTAQPETHDHAHAHRKEEKDSVAVSQFHVSPGSMADKILGFRRFQRKGKQASPLAPLKPTVPATASVTSSGPAIQPSANAQTPIPIKRPSKIERLLGEPGTSLTDTSLIAIQKKDHSENEIEKPWVQNHSRTRTASSQLLNDNILPKPLPRSSTTPTLPMINRTSQSPKLIDQNMDPQPGEPPAPASPKRVTPRGPRSPPADIKALPKAPPEIIVESVTGEGLVHKTSIKRPRSNPMLQTATASPHQLPSLDFLPQLRHQPLTKPKRTSPIRPNSSISPTFPTSATFPDQSSPVAKSSSEPHLPSTNTLDLKIAPRSPLRPSYHQPRPENALIRPGPSSRRRTMDPTGSIGTLGPLSFGKGGTAEGLGPKPIAKLFVICCKCKFWHDLPSKMYELMALPQKLSRTENEEKTGNALEKAKEATLDTMVKCPWCDHYMTTWCCAGWTTVVYLHERHH